MTKLDIPYNYAAPAIVFSDTTNSRFQAGIGSFHVSNEGQRLDFYTGDSSTNGTLLTNTTEGNPPRMCVTGTGNVGIGTDAPSFTLDVKHDTGANPACIARLLGASGAGIRFHSGTGGTFDTWKSTGINLSGTSGGGAILFVFTMNNSAQDNTGALLYFIRKAFDQAYWAQTNSGAVTYLGGGSGGGSATTASFRMHNSMLEYKVVNGGNGVFYAIEFDK